MALTDEELLDFDESNLVDYDPAKTQQALQEHGDVFRAQLVAARWVERWANGLAGDTWTLPTEVEQRKGVIWALREVAGHLRQGDLIPGGNLYEETVNPR
jgi:hypothetical protein